MRITELFTAKSIELDSAASNRDEILSRLVELQATHGNITDTEAYKNGSLRPGRMRPPPTWTTASRSPRQDECGHPAQPGRPASEHPGAVQRRR